MKNTRKKGFTIVELVIVIAVIAILAAVLIPTFSNVITNAKEAAAQSDAKTTWTQYCVDKAEAGFSDFNGYIRIAKDSNNSSYYYFAITNGVLNTLKNQSTQSGGIAVDGYNGLYKTT